MEPSGPIVRRYGLPVRKKISLKKPVQTIDLMEDNESGKLSTVQPFHLADSVTTAVRTGSAAETANGNTESNVTAVTRKQSLKSVVTLKKIPNNPTGDSLTIRETRKDIPINDISVDHIEEIAMCDEILTSLPEKQSPEPTSNHRNAEVDEAVFKLHPSPTPSIEEAGLPSSVHVNIRSPVQTLHESKSLKR